MIAMQYLNIDEARRGLNPRRGKEPSTKYLDNLKEISPTNLRRFEREIIIDEDKSFAEMIKQRGRNPKKIKALAQPTYDRLYPIVFSKILERKYSETETFADKMQGDPLRWIESNIQTIYEELLKGNPLALIYSMITARELKAVEVGKNNKKQNNETKRLLQLIEPNNEAYAKLDKSLIEEFSTNFLTQLNNIHTEPEDTEQQFSNRQAREIILTKNKTDFESIIKIFNHMINRSDTNLQGPFADFIKNGKNLESKAAWTKRIILLGDSPTPAVIESLTSNLLTFKTSQKTRIGTGLDLKNNRRIPEWASSEYKRQLRMVGENQKIFTVAGVTVAQRDKETNKLVIDAGAKKEAEDALIANTKKANSTERQSFNKWIENEGLKNITQVDLPSQFNDLRFMKLLTSYYMQENPTPFVIPQNYSPVFMEGEDDLVRAKGEQFLNLISFASKFGAEGLEEINFVLSEIQEIIEDQSIRALSREAEELETQISEAVEKILIPIVQGVTTELLNWIKSISFDEIKSKGNYLTVSVNKQNLDPWDFLKTLSPSALRQFRPLQEEGD